MTTLGLVRGPCGTEPPPNAKSYNESAYRDFRDRYRDMARTLGFEGHIGWAEAMP